MNPLSPLDFAFYIGSTPTFYILICISTLHAYRLRSTTFIKRLVHLRGYYQRIVTPVIANENRRFVIAPCKFILIDITTLYPSVDSNICEIENRF